MAIANLKVIICDCDELILALASTCPNEIEADTVTHARKLAKEAGWTVISEDGRSYDLCPTHSAQYETRSRLAG